MRPLAIALVCSLVVGCASSVSASPSEPVVPSPTSPLPAVLSIDSRGGPPVIIEIGTFEAARVGCSSGEIVTPGEAGVPPLPWDLRVIKQSDGQVLLSSRITELPQWVVLFGEAVQIGSTPVAGPAGPPCPSGP